MTTPEMISAISATVTLLGLVTVWLQPVIRNTKDKLRKETAFKTSVSLYLDSLEIKACIALDRMKHHLPPIPLEDSFEGVYRNDFNALEKLCLDSSTLKLNEQMQLLRFVRYFKTSPNMISSKQLLEFISLLNGSEMRRLFPRAADLDEVINRWILPPTK